MNLESEKCVNCEHLITPDMGAEYETCPECKTSYKVTWHGSIPVLKKIGGDDVQGNDSEK